jgi:hypothetical protein
MIAEKHNSFKVKRVCNLNVTSLVTGFVTEYLFTVTSDAIKQGG